MELVDDPFKEKENSIIQRFKSEVNVKVKSEERYQKSICYFMCFAWIIFWDVNAHVPEVNRNQGDECVLRETQK